MNKLSVTTMAIALVGSTTLVSAQASFEDMLDLFEAGAKAEGAVVEFSERTVSGDGSVEYRDLSITDPDGGVTFATDWLRGSPSADDDTTITFTVADTISITGDADGEPINFEIRSDDLEITTNAILAESHGDTDITVSFDADSLVIEGGDPTSLVLREVMAEIEDLAFSTIFSIVDQKAEGSLTTGVVSAVYDMSIDGQTQKVDQTSESMEIAFNFDIPAGEEEAIGFLDGSKNGTATFVSGKTTFDSSIEQDGMAFDYNGITEGGRGEISMVDGTLTYDITNGAIDLTVIPGGGAPFPPVEVAMSELVFKVLLPLNSAEKAETAIVDILFADLAVGEGLWAMIDPGQTIPRDPANLAIDLDANVQIDALTAAMTGVDNPFEAAIIDNLNVNKILLSIGGAMLESDGAMTFDNSGPFPMPMGALNVALSGAQGLADKLVNLGLVDQMQVGMMMGMVMAFAKPDGDDKFVSEITFSEDGIFANGQPIR